MYFQTYYLPSKSLCHSFYILVETKRGGGRNPPGQGRTKRPGLNRVNIFCSKVQCRPSLKNKWFIKMHLLCHLDSGLSLKSLKILTERVLAGMSEPKLPTWRFLSGDELFLSLSV